MSSLEGESGTKRVSALGRESFGAKGAVERPLSRRRGVSPGRSRRSPLPEGHSWIGHPDLGVSGPQLREDCLRFGEEVRATL